MKYIHLLILLLSSSSVFSSLQGATLLRHHERRQSFIKLDYNHAGKVTNIDDIMRKLKKTNYALLKTLHRTHDYIVILRKDPEIVNVRDKKTKAFLINNALLEILLIMNPSFVRGGLLPVLQTHNKELLTIINTSIKALDNTISKLAKNNYNYQHLLNNLKQQSSFIHKSYNIRLIQEIIDMIEEHIADDIEPDQSIVTALSNIETELQEADWQLKQYNMKIAGQYLENILTKKLPKAIKTMEDKKNTKDTIYKAIQEANLYQKQLNTIKGKRSNNILPFDLSGKKSHCITDMLSSIHLLIAQYISRTHMCDKIIFDPIGPSILNTNDSRHWDHTKNEHIRLEKYKKYFNTLRQRGQFFAYDEFKKMFPNQSYFKNNYVDKTDYNSSGNSFGRILGAHYIQKTALMLAQHRDQPCWIKVPWKFAVKKQPKQGKCLDTFTIEENINYSARFGAITSTDLHVYAEKVCKVDLPQMIKENIMSQHQAKELIYQFFEVLQVSGYYDTFPDNFIFGISKTKGLGLYFIDTEITQKGFAIPFSREPTESIRNYKAFINIFGDVIDEQEHTALINKYVGFVEHRRHHSYQRIRGQYPKEHQLNREATNMKVEVDISASFRQKAYEKSFTLHMSDFDPLSFGILLERKQAHIAYNNNHYLQTTIKQLQQQQTSDSSSSFNPFRRKKKNIRNNHKLPYVNIQYDEAPYKESDETSLLQPSSSIPNRSISSSEISLIHLNSLRYITSYSRLDDHSTKQSKQNNNASTNSKSTRLSESSEASHQSLLNHSKSENTNQPSKISSIIDSNQKHASKHIKQSKGKATLYSIKKVLIKNSSAFSLLSMIIIYFFAGSVLDFHLFYYSYPYKRINAVNLHHTSI